MPLEVSRPLSCAQAHTRVAHWAHSALDSRGFSVVRLFLFLPLYRKSDMLCTAYQQPVKYNLAVAREVLKHVYTAERLQPPTSFGAVLGTYSTLWARARSIGYWRDVVRSGEYARLGVYAIEAYGIFKVRVLASSPLFSSERAWPFFQVGEIVGRRSFVGYNLQ